MENTMHGAADQRQRQRVCPSVVWKDYDQLEPILHCSDEMEFLGSHPSVTPANVYVAPCDELMNIAGVLACFNRSRPGGTHRLPWFVVISFFHSPKLWNG